jgi:hypothetical protein
LVSTLITALVSTTLATTTVRGFAALAGNFSLLVVVHGGKTTLTALVSTAASATTGAAATLVSTGSFAALAANLSHILSVFAYSLATLAGYLALLLIVHCGETSLVVIVSASVSTLISSSHFSSPFRLLVFDSSIGLHSGALSAGEAHSLYVPQQSVL